MAEHTFDWDNYVRLSYIESSGTQYIDTGVDETIYLTVDCKLDNPNPTNHYLYGAQQNSRSWMYNGLYAYVDNSDTTGIEYNWADVIKLNNPNPTSVELSQRLSGSTVNITANGQSVQVNIGTTSSGARFYIGACNGGKRIYPNTMRIYYFKMRNDPSQKLVRSYIPAKRRSDNAIGLYDLVTQTFYLNAGAGVYTEGPAIPGGEGTNMSTDTTKLPDNYRKIPYLSNETNSGAYIVGTYKHNVSTTLDIDIEPAIIKDGNWSTFYGSGSADNSAGTFTWGIGNKSSTYHTYLNADIYGITGKNSMGAPFSNSCSMIGPIEFRVGYRYHLQLGWQAVTYKSITETDGYNAIADSTYDAYNGQQVVFGTGGTGNTYDKPDAIFARTLNGSLDTGEPAWVRIYGLTIYEDINLSTPVRKYIPAQRNDGVLGLYETVEGKFYTNAGTGSFTAPVSSGWTGYYSKTLKGPTSTTDKTSKAWNMLSTTTSQTQKLTAVNKFSVTGLSSTGMTEEGFCNRTYTVAAGSYDNISKYTVSKGAAVIVQNNNTYGSDLILAGMGVGGDVVGDSVYNAVWNDMVDCIEVPEDTKLEYGRCYIYDGETYKPSTKYLDDGIIGIHSDTAGFYVGSKPELKCLEVAVAGFALAYVDKIYKSGTPLTCGPDGILTELKEEDLECNPHKLVATFWKKEWATWWGFNRPQCNEHIIEVNNRMWVKVK